MSETKLRKYQIEGAQAIHKFNGRALLADEMGLGKSLQTLYWCHKMKSARPVVIVCPAALKHNWQREAKMHLGLRSVILDGTTAWKDVPLDCPGIYILNYEILKGWLDFFTLLKPQVLILDEVHYIKNRKTIRYKKVKQLVKICKYVIGLSGTPITNRPYEIWSAVNLINPEIPFFTNGSNHKFGIEFCNAQMTHWGWQYNGAEKLDKLHSILSENVMIRRLKKDVLKELPIKTRTVVPVKLKSYTEYNIEKAAFLDWLREQKKVADQQRKNGKKANKFTHEALVKFGYLKRLAAKHKQEIAVSWIENFLSSSDKKLVVMAIHRKMIAYIQAAFASQCVVVDGSLSGAKRQLMVDKFQTNPECRLFIGNIKAAGVGITLTAASDVLFTEFGFVPGEMTQAEDRIHRIGQTNVSTIHYLMALNTIEEKLCNILHEKQKVLDNTIDGISDSEGINVFEKAIKMEFGVKL